MRTRIVGAVSALAALATVAILTTGGDAPYKVRLYLSNASGLKSGSPVIVGGVTAGSVAVKLDDRDRIVADLKLDNGVGPVGKDASAAITATNFLGQKRVELTLGDTRDPAPSGAVLPAANVTTPTDLDQVLAVLDSDTRTRTMILLNEAGGAVFGRQVDIRSLLKDFPIGLSDAAGALHKLGADNRSLRDVVAHTGRFVAQVTAQRAALTRTVATVGQTAKLVATRRAELQTTLSRAPGTLRTLQRFLTQLDATARPLGPAARAIQQAAGPLSDTLAQVKPFTNAANPTLAEATAVAPVLTSLANRATPVLRRAAPVAGDLAVTSRALPPVADTLDHSADNVIAILENWSRAIQFRDGLGHVFRGEATVSAELLNSMLRRLLPATTGRGGKPADPKAPAKPGLLKQLVTPAKPPVSNAAPAAAPVPAKPLDALASAVEKTLSGLVPPPKQGDPGDGTSGKSLLDYLLRP
jgi:virulence factor Mce-like protein